MIFYFFSLLAIGSGLMVVFSRNPVHAVLWLILAFLSAAGLFVIQGAEFIAMLLIIVYVGAVAVLFLFVVMMLDVDFATLKAGMARYIPLGLLIGVVFLLILGIELSDWTSSGIAPDLRQAIQPADVQNTEALGNVIYTEYVFLFQIAGLILLVAMIGAIVLTHRKREGVKKQDVVSQMYRDSAKSVSLEDVPSGKGLS
ncbi:MAG: NADH-quinone oxidoreductase subunit J [Rhodobacteraceae bacterium]|nr:NADH-quinone oxidoreductase subunit J [Paracoccaceae bacterium]MYG42816.1 NADH-quinone oxidoreductase subunit J [Paracoccaceae bacterium]